MPAEVSREYDALKRRNFQPYTMGHRIMYEVPLTLMNRNERTRDRFSILEAGFGIGCGLDRMVKEGVINAYLGYEPDADSFRYVAQRHQGNRALTLRNSPYGYPGGYFDHVFCIEVIEHVERDDHAQFLRGLQLATREGGTLWLSTPDSSHSSHGVRTASAWREMLRDVGFDDVSVHQEQWTTLFICQTAGR